MPIKGLSDQAASFPRIGVLRKGAPKPKTGNKPGADLDHFRFDTTDDDAIAAFNAAYGDEPDSINVFLPFDTTDENFESWVEKWGSGSLHWRGDGEKLVIWQRDDGTYSRQPKPQPDGGKETGRLKVIIPELKRLAYVVVLTTSIHDIIELSSNLRAYEALRGSLQGIPFVLSRVPRMVSTPGKNGRVRREKWLLHIEAAPQWVQSQLSVMKRQALPGGDDLLALESGELVDVDTGEMLDDELPTTEFEEIKGATETDNGADKAPEKTAVNGDAPWMDGDAPDTLPKFAEWYAERHPYYDNNFHVVGTLKKPEMFGESIGTTFRQRDATEYQERLDQYAKENADKEAA